MSKLVDMYFEWCTSMQPKFLGFIMWMTACLVVFVLGTCIFVGSIVITNGLAILAIPSVILCVLCIAKFRQGTP